MGKAAGPIKQDDSIGYGPHWGQKQFHASSAKTRVLACGRRWGKDRASIMEMLVFLVNLRDTRVTQLTPDQLRQFVPLVHAWVVAPTYALTLQHWREFLAFVPRDLIGSGTGTSGANANEHVLQLCDGDIVIEFKSEEKPETLVGTGLDMLLVTESGIISDRAWYESLQPTLRSPGRLGRALLNGTPKGQRGFFWHLFQLGQQPAHQKRVQSWNFTSYQNPLLSQEQLDELEFDKLHTPEHTFRQEYMAEFIADGAFFRRVDACSQGMPVDGPEEGHTYLLGLDLARLHDFTAAVVLDISVTPHRQVYLDRWNRVDWDFQLARIAALIAHWRIRHAAVDQTGVGDMPVQTLTKHFAPQGIVITGVLFTGLSKNPIIEGLALAFEQDQIAILSDETQRKELLSYRAIHTPSGVVRYTAPAGGYDDTVIALALVWYIATEGRRQDPQPASPPRLVPRVSPWHRPGIADYDTADEDAPQTTIRHGVGPRIGPVARPRWRY